MANENTIPIDSQPIYQFSREKTMIDDMRRWKPYSDFKMCLEILVGENVKKMLITTLKNTKCREDLSFDILTTLTESPG